ncbi:sulfurtransferase TusA family protein [Paenibacillus sp. 1011MAR3C5]|uniref:sulfurtransferase TusA family protein n=1 Tax=Paenibacillus sp. 1011MAR3C5 TaxID=1675787 RepID=UPI000E6C6860|nr:sulfurtransferase TusA family protein [Paenibacillus sp. 1011MAR3C5]RJE84364.1 sulfurtransferase TusA family protein [Paenibacillus sp. 1011MAR3C5]
MKTEAVVVDTKGLACPMPIVKAKKALDSMETGQMMKVLSTDQGSLNDFRAWVKGTKHELVQYEEKDGLFTFYVKKQ